MTSYLSLVPKHLSAHKTKSRLTVFGVAIAVALVTGIFSMLDALLQFEKTQVIHDVGNYHLVVKDATDREMQAIDSRIDVQNAGVWVSFKNGRLNERACQLGALDERFAKNMNIAAVEGHFPEAATEIMLERWAAESFQRPLAVGDSAEITFSDGTVKTFVISGLYNDLSNTKASGTPGVFLSIAGARAANVEKSSFYLVEFKSGVNIAEAEKAIKSNLKLADDRVAHNERLLAVIGQSTSSTVIGVYATGAVLFSFVLIASVLMIFNTFNISVMERVRQFGLLRCIGASRSQIIRLVRKEALHITARAIPVGVAAGLLVALLCSTLLKFYNSSIFGDIPLLQISLPGIGAGIAVGFLTVFVASFLPARKAASVSPVSAVTGGDVGSAPKEKRALLTKAFRIEIAMGISNAVEKRKTLFLMSSSIAISIAIFLGFQVLVDFLNTSLRTTKPYTPDISLVSEQGIDGELHRRLSELDGVDKVYGRMFGYVDATFNAERLTDSYKESVGGVVTRGDGMFDPPEKSWLISYDEDQLAWAQADLIDGELSEKELDEQNGVIAVAVHLRDNVTTETANLRVGDKVHITTRGGAKEMTVLGVLRSLPFGDSKLTMAAFVTTEKLFTELTSESSYKVIDLQLRETGQERTVNEIKGMLNSSIRLHDARQKNTEIDQAFFTMAVFIYGFVTLIGLISVLNIINTMNTSVASKTRYLGVLRAVGMSDAQLDTMVFVEAATYSLIGGIAGCVLGVLLQQALIANLLSQLHITWKFPATQIGLILVFVVVVAAVSVVGPLKRIKARSASEVIASL
ncbi:MAG: ABC transporter permease [Chloroflexota bacterium]